MYVLITLLIIVLILFICYISTLNKIKRLFIKVNESLSGIDIALTKRYDVLAKMVEVVKGYAKHEKEVLIKVIELREKMSVNELRDANNSMDENFNYVNVLVENYPEIKADEHFRILQKSIVDVEEHLQAARRVYNANVSRYNQVVLSFPSSVVAKINNYSELEFFEANDVAKENVNIELNNK